MTLRLTTLLALASTLLAGCATLTENECRAGDWYGIGVQDGANGRLTSHLSNHVKACADYGIKPDQALWLAGRKEGLVTYCTPARAYREGRSGHDMSPVCSADQAAVLANANLIGLRYYEITQDIREAERDLDEIRAAISGLSPDDPAYARLISQMNRTRFHIQRLKSRRLRYASWP